MMLRALKVPAIAGHVDVGSKAARDGWSIKKHLRELVELERGQRKTRRIERLPKNSGPATGKTLAALQQEKLPVKTRRQLVPPTHKETHHEGHDLLGAGVHGGEVTEMAG